jgi:DNA-directed RNA polymerase alpha subunit
MLKASTFNSSIIYNASLFDIDVPYQIANKLYDAKIVTVSDVLNKTIDELDSVEGLSSREVDELFDHLAKYGIASSKGCYPASLVKTNINKYMEEFLGIPSRPEMASYIPEVKNQIDL